MSKITNNRLTRSGTGWDRLGVRMTCNFQLYPYGNSGRERVKLSYRIALMRHWSCVLLLIAVGWMELSGRSMSVLRRLASFASLPSSSPVSCVRLANCGFIYAGQSDILVCQHCGDEFRGWLATPAIQAPNIAAQIQLLGLQPTTWPCWGKLFKTTATPATQLSMPSATAYSSAPLGAAYWDPPSHVTSHHVTLIDLAKRPHHDQTLAATLSVTGWFHQATQVFVDWGCHYQGVMGLHVRRWFNTVRRAPAGGGGVICPTATDLSNDERRLLLTSSRLVLSQTCSEEKRRVV